MGLNSSHNARLDQEIAIPTGSISPDKWALYGGMHILNGSGQPFMVLWSSAHETDKNTLLLNPIVNRQSSWVCEVLV